MAIDEDLRARLAALGAATLGESGGRAMRARLGPVWPGARVAGPALPVRCTPGDNLAIHVAVAAATAGAVLVVDVGEIAERGYWGEVLTTAAQARGVAGLVIDGGVRDVAALAARGFGVFSTMVALPGASKDQPGTVGAPTTVGGVVVAAGDWIVGDVDGVVAIAAADVHAVVAAGEARAEREAVLFDRLAAGATTVELLGLDPTPVVVTPEG